MVSNLILLKNIAVNVLIRIASSGMFFVYIPLASRRLDEDNFNTFTILLSVVLFVMVFYDFSASTKGIKDLVESESPRDIVNSHIQHRIIVFVLVSVFLFIYSYSIFNDLKLFLAFSFFHLGYAFNSQWIALGDNKLKEQAMVDITLKLVVPSVILFFYGYDVITFLVVIGLSYFLSNVFIIAKYLSLSSRLLSVTWYRSEFSFFISKILISSYTTLIPIIGVGLLGIAQFNEFIISEKFYRGLFSIYGPVSMALFPFFVKQVANKDVFNKKLLSLSYLQLSFSVVSVLFLIFWSRELLFFYSGHLVSDYTNDSFRILLCSIPMMILGNITGIQNLLSKGEVRLFNYGVSFGLLGLFFFVVLNQYVIELNFSFSILFSEVSVAFALFYFSYRSWK